MNVTLLCAQICLLKEQLPSPTAVQEEDIQLIQNRIRARLVGGTPAKNTLAESKRAIQDGDEWARVFEYNIAEGKKMDAAFAEEDQERRRQMRLTLDRQKQVRGSLSAAATVN
jgi:hypothetical protein